MIKKKFKIIGNGDYFYLQTIYTLYKFEFWHKVETEEMLLFSDILDKKAILEKQEKKDVLDREIKVIWSSVFILLVAIFCGIYKWILC